MVLAVFNYDESPANVIVLSCEDFSGIDEIFDLKELEEIQGWCLCEIIYIHDGVIKNSFVIRSNWYKCRRYLSGLMAHLTKTLPLLEFMVEGDLLYVSDASGFIDVKLSIALFYQDDPDYSAITEAILHRILDNVTGSHTHVINGRLEVIPEEEENNDNEHRKD